MHKDNNAGQNTHREKRDYMTFLITLIVIAFIVFFIILLYSLCCVAHDADEMMNYSEGYVADSDEIKDAIS